MATKVEEDVKQIPTQEAMDILKNLSLLSDQIKDFIDENTIEDDIDSESFCEYIKAIDALRIKYREIFYELPQDFPDYKKMVEKYENVTGTIKQYIKNAKSKSKSIQNEKLEASIRLQNESFDFSYNNISLSISSMESIVKTKIEELSDEDIVSIASKFSALSKTFNNTSEKIKELFTDTTAKNNGDKIIKLKRDYESLCEKVKLFSTDLSNENKKREIEKLSHFNNKQLKIDLCKFSGYDSSIDVFTFKSKFSKLFNPSTPKKYLPDILKNNYLEGSASSLVKYVDNIDEIWERLIESYGDTRLLLTYKMQIFQTMEPLWRTKNSKKVIDGLTNIINVMKDLKSLAIEHKIKNRLFNGEVINKIYKLIGDARTTRHLQNTCDEKLDDEKMWDSLMKFLERELRIQQQKQVINYKDNEQQDKPLKSQSHFTINQGKLNNNIQSNCFICGANDHVFTAGPNNTKLIQYFVCEKFNKMTPKERFYELHKKNLCFQCLFPGAESSTGKHRNGQCQRDFACPHPDHDQYPRRKHILVCDEHKNDDANKKLLEQYISRCISKKVDIPEFAKNISNHICDVTHPAYASRTYPEAINESGIYQLQHIFINGKKFLVFFDSGCSDCVIREGAIKDMGSQAELAFKAPIQIKGVGDVSTQSSTGLYSIQIPTFNNESITLMGVSLSKLTSKFPTYPIKGEIENDIRTEFTNQGNNVNILPNLPDYVGGEVDIMIGVKYLRYFPQPVFQLPTGLTIYRSIFRNPDGSRGVIGGPHPLISSINQAQYNIQDIYFSNKIYARELMKFSDGFGTPLLCYKNSFHKKSQDIFESCEEAGTNISYRCTKCRHCVDCKNNDKAEALSIKEEIEQDIINKSITIDTSNNSTVAVLPFVQDPMYRLAPNRHKALKVYFQQVKKLNKTLFDKNDVIESESKLQKLGHVDFVKNLPPDIQQKLSNSEFHYYIPWRAVWKPNSSTTPCRIVFDASQPTDSGYSLNSILAKGTNGMNNLAEIMIRWFTQRIAFHTDVHKMYNSILLHDDQWCFQRYLWNNSLDINALPEEKIIKTLIYGIRSSGNQAERGLRLISETFKEQYPLVNDIISNDVYVDDCITGCADQSLAMKLADDMEYVLGKGGFRLKGFTFSGSHPPSNLTKDGESIPVGGMLWFPKLDVVTLDISPLNFARKQRGKKPPEHLNIIPQNITRRMCVSRVSELFDITGKITPITASLKLDLHNLIERKLDWDDVIPDDMRAIWLSNFEMIEELKSIKFHRAIVPPDAESLEMSTIDFGDASKSLASVAIYARFKRINGTFSSQLIFARSKILPSNISQPRAELIAALLNAHTGEIVKRSLKERHISAKKLTDSQIVLHWLTNENITLKQYVRNRIIEIQRFTDTKDWFYVNSKNMLADIATRKGASVSDVTQSSRWINGDEWMTGEESQFPIKSVKDISLSKSDIQEIQNESLASVNFQENVSNSYAVKIPEEVSLRYSFSKYVIDPNKFKFSKTVRILAYVFKFLSKLKERKKGVVTRSQKLHHSNYIITDVEIAVAENYFWRKGSDEVRHFVKKEKYEKISKDVDGILMYTGRILSDDNVYITVPMSKVMLDLHNTVFCVPILDKYSPISYAIVNEIHWYNKSVKHGGTESTLRFVLKKAFIIECRDIITRIKNSCKFCRYIHKEKAKVVMGNIPSACLTVAPAFYNTQVDLAGPYDAFTNHNKRKTIKIWLAVFCCSTTSTVAIKVMDDCSSSSFLQAFTRFACDNGYPKCLFIDQGTQLMNSCKKMLINFRDAQHNLFKDVSVEFTICPVNGHNYNGKVERNIREIKSSINKSFRGLRLSVIQWETISAEVANAINDIPLAIGNAVSNFENVDLITPNRLKLGRNNDRSPTFTLQLTKRFSNIMESNRKIFQSWFDSWLLSHVPKLVVQPKWFKKSRDISVNDIVLFIKNDSSLSPTYQYGIIREVYPSKDGNIRKVKVGYKNASENVFRESIRAVRELIVIHQQNEKDLTQELNDMYDE